MFIHLRVKSDYSLLQSAIKTEQVVEACIKYRMPAVSINDSMTLAGCLEFCERAAAHGVQPIISCDVRLKLGDVLFNIVLLVQNQRGYLHLLNLVSNAFRTGERCITFEQLRTQHEGMICLSGDLFLTIEKAQSAKITSILKELFEDRFYLEIQRHPNKSPHEVYILEMAKKCALPIVATNNVLFSSKDICKAHDALLSIKNGRYLAEEDRELSNPEFYFKSAEEMRGLFIDIPDALENTILIAQRCSFILKEIPPKLPRYQGVESENDALRSQANSGLRSRFIDNVPAEYQERLDYEVEVICKMNYAGYFLIVADFVDWGKRNGIPIGPGRGSGVGSLVSWAIGITEVNPIIYGLIFERFLNPERISMPDFDIDFCQEKRDLVIQYIVKKYKNVAHIITFGKLQPRAVIRDVGRVMALPYWQLDEICKAIPHNPVNPVSLSEAIAMDPDLQQKQETNQSIAELFDLSLKLEGLYRHASVHAAGIVISSEPITDLVPLFYEQGSQLPITQYSMKYVEKAGLIKFDFLGLKTLTTIAKARELIDDENLCFDITDTQTYLMLSRGDSVGIFQLENHFMQDVLKKLKPDSIEDIIALISLNRPGPMSNIPIYIERKHGDCAVVYPHPCLEPILKETFGVIIYQEQVMQMAQVLSGYTMSEADLLRRAMGKKIPSEMEKQKSTFIEGATSRGVDKEKAQEIFLLVEKFAGYGFNKSHAAAYAMISFETAYLKAHYPMHFLVALMNVEIHSTDKLIVFFHDAKQHNIQILPPDVNKSQAHFSIEGSAIRYALGAIKNVGTNAAELIAERDYTSLEDFMVQINKKSINRKTVEGLIKSGAMDCLEGNRRKLLESIDSLMGFIGKNNHSNQAQLFRTRTEDILIGIDDYTYEEKLQIQFESIGFYLSGHPLDNYLGLIKNLQKNRVFGVISSIKMRSSKNSRFVNIMIDSKEEMKSITFYDDKIIDASRDCLLEGKLVSIESLPRGSGGGGYIGRSIMLLSDFFLIWIKRLRIAISTIEDIDLLRTILKENGKVNVDLLVSLDGKQILITLNEKYYVGLEEFFILNNKFSAETFLQ